MKIALYLRVSTKEQDVSSQRIQLTDRCRRMGWEVIGEWVDIMSGSKAARPGLDALLMECSASRVEAIAVVKLDRLGRSVVNTLRLLQRLDAMGVGIICTSQGIDTRKSNPMSRCIFTVMAAFGELERDFIRERTVDGLVAARAAGAVLGHPNPGLLPESQRGAVIAAWETGREGGLRGLGRLLGGVSQTTAHKLYRAYVARGGAAAVAAMAGTQNSAVA